MSEHDSQEAKMNDRRTNNWRDVALALALLSNFGALVWGAATIKSSVDQLQGSVQDLNKTTATIVTDLAAVKVEYNARLSVLEDRSRRTR